ncbi:MAG: diguanylate cyclase [Pseudomonadota bacterium]
MQGRLLILDAVPTNRIVLNALLEPACFGVSQGSSIADGIAALAQDPPDLILTAWSLPDGTAMDLCAALSGPDPDRQIPVVAIAHPGDGADRQGGLRAGLTDLMVHPLNEGMLHARLRSLLRSQLPATAFELAAAPATPAAPDGSGAPRHTSAGFAEAPSPFAPAERVAILANDTETAATWSQGLSASLNQSVAGYTWMQRQDVLGAFNAPDVFVVSINGDRPDPAFRFLSDLRAGPTTRHAAAIAVSDAGDVLGAAHALDLGADDVMHGPFDAGELALRIHAQLRRKRLSDRVRSTVRDGLRAALVDPMTGLYNRRYAIPHLAHIMRQSVLSGRHFAVMMADLDHFKRINDTHGHMAGDAILIEVSERLRAALGQSGMLARIGGEEFLIVLAEADAATVRQTADCLRAAVGTTRFSVAASGRSEQMTISIGAALCPPADAGAGYGFSENPQDPRITAVLQQADKALYESKHAGRNTVTFVRAAA